MAVLFQPMDYVVNVHFGGEQQGLVADWSSLGPFDAGTPTATALDSHDTFDGVNMGASGLGYTVLTKGLVCFGKPRDGEACFMAAPDFILPINYYSETNTPQSNTIRRGVVKSDDEGDGELEWTVVGGGDGLTALTFAGEAFHAVYCDPLNNTASIETSFDGETWSSQSISTTASGGGILEGSVILSGAVAYSGDVEDEKGSYASVGTALLKFQVDEHEEDSANLAWHTAEPPPPPASEDETPPSDLGWSSDYIKTNGGNPGTSLTQGLMCSVAGGKGIFVAATCENEIIAVPRDEGFDNIPVTTATASTSPDGSSWSQNDLPGVISGSAGTDFFGSSNSVAVVFVPGDDGDEDGYFLCTTANGSDAGAFSTVHKSDNGDSWRSIKTSTTHLLTLSTIAKDPSATTIVHV